MQKYAQSALDDYQFNAMLDEFNNLIDMVEELKDIFNLYSVDENGIVTQPLTVDELQAT